MLKSKIIIAILGTFFYSLAAQDEYGELLNMNKPEREGWFTELGFGMFINGEAFDGTVPCSEYHDGDVWLLQSLKRNCVYAIYLDPEQKPWHWGTRKDFFLTNYQMNENSRISVLGHGGEVLEYAEEADAAPRMENRERGLKIDVMRAQRIYNDRKWPNPIVVKLENIEEK